MINESTVEVKSETGMGWYIVFKGNEEDCNKVFDAFGKALHSNFMDRMGGKIRKVIRPKVEIPPPITTVLHSHIQHDGNVYD